MYPAAPDSLLTTGAAAVKPQLTILGTLGGSDASAPDSPVPKPGLDSPLLPQEFVQPAIVNGIVVKGLPAELRDMLQKQSAVVQAIIPDFVTRAASTGKHSRFRSWMGLACENVDADAYAPYSSSDCRCEGGNLFSTSANRHSLLLLV